MRSFSFSLSQLIRVILVLVVVLSPFIVNLALNLRSLVPGMLLGHIIALPILAHGQKFSHGITKSFLIIYSCFALLIAINTMLSGAKFDEMIGLLFMILLLSVNASLFTFRLLKNPDSWRDTFLWVYFFLILLAFHNIVFDRGSILFIGEPSFFALVAGPFALIVYSLNRNMGPANVFILLVLGLLFPNVTCLIFCLIQLAWIILEMRYKLIFITLMALVAINVDISNLVQSNEYIASRVTVDSDLANLSSLLYLANWQDVITRITSFQIFGSGIGSTADYLSIRNEYEYEVIQRYGTNFSYSNGTFWLARALQTMGFSALLVVLIILWNVRNTLARAGWKIQNLSPMAHLQLTLYSSIIPELFFRSASILGPAAFIFFIALNLSRRASGNIKSYSTGEFRGTLRN